MGDSIAHFAQLNETNPILKGMFANGIVPWIEASPPNLAGGLSEAQGRLRSCSYCGSMHPADVAAAIRAGAIGSWARKYGWPHKAYFDNIPNPHAGMLESRAGHSHPPQEEIDSGKWVRVQDGFDRRTGEPVYTFMEAGKPAGATTGGKFYSIHLQDATPEERAVIENHLGLSFDFRPNGSVSWKPYELPGGVT